MNEKDNNKANAAILLSADEAVEKKILAVLLKNPQLIQNALDTLERERMAYQSQQYQNSLAQSMMNTKNQMAQQIYNSQFASNTSGQIANNQNAIQPLPWKGSR
jgi:uncharacterized protein with von Willebrand factor type A (vWA) domain